PPSSTPPSPPRRPSSWPPTPMSRPSGCAARTSSVWRVLGGWRWRAARTGRGRSDKLPACRICNVRQAGSLSLRGALLDPLEDPVGLPAAAPGGEGGGSLLAGGRQADAVSVFVHELVDPQPGRRRGARHLPALIDRLGFPRRVDLRRPLAEQR